MFCTKCGKQIPDSTKFCPYCGANCSPEQDIAGQAGQVFNKVEKKNRRNLMSDRHAFADRMWNQSI